MGKHRNNQRYGKQAFVLFCLMVWILCMDTNTALAVRPAATKDQKTIVYHMYNTEHFSIGAPSGWIHESDNKLGRHWLYAKAAGSIRGGYLYISETPVDSIILSTDEELKDLYEAFLDGISSGSTFDGNLYSEPTTIAEKYAYRYGFDSNTSGGVHFEGYLLYNDGILLSVLYTDESNDVDAIRGIARSFSNLTYCGNAKKLTVCEGVITQITLFDILQDVWIDFITQTNDGLVEKWATYHYGNCSDIKTLDYGDTIKLYYAIDEEEQQHLLSIVPSELSHNLLEEYENEYKSKCKEYTYKSIARNPEKVKGEYATISGEVVQVIEKDSNIELRVNITKESWGYSDTIYVTYTRKSHNEDRILEDDIITIWGTLQGMTSYESILSAQVSLPLMAAEYIVIDSLE